MLHHAIIVVVVQLFVEYMNSCSYVHILYAEKEVENMADEEKRDEEQEVEDTDADTKDIEESEKTDEEQEVEDTDADTEDVEDADTHIDDRLDRLEEMVERALGEITRISDAQTALIDNAGAIVEEDEPDLGLDDVPESDVMDLSIDI